MPGTGKALSPRLLSHVRAVTLATAAAISATACQDASRGVAPPARRQLHSPSRRGRLPA